MVRTSRISRSSLLMTLFAVPVPFVAVGLLDHAGPALLGALFVFVLGLPRALLSVCRVRVDGGVLHAEAIGRGTDLDLRGGFVLEQMRLGDQNLRLRAGDRSVFLRGFGTLDEVDAWLKEAQVAV